MTSEERATVEDLESTIVETERAVTNFLNQHPSLPPDLLSEIDDLGVLLVTRLRRQAEIERRRETIRLAYDSDRAARNHWRTSRDRGHLALVP